MKRNLPDSDASEFKRKKSKSSPISILDSRPEFRLLTGSVIIRKHDPPHVIPDDLGYRGRFAVWTPKHVILESLDGKKLSINQAALRQSRPVFLVIQHTRLNL